MTWLAVILLALAVIAALFFWMKVPRNGLAVLSTTLLLGLAGYATQASPNQPSAPRAAEQKFATDPHAMIAARDLLDESEIAPTNQWIVISDALSRNGQHAGAAEVLLGALDDDPKNALAWLALGNALIAHADGLLTPAALHAYDRAARAAPESPGPPYFLGLALAQSGRFDEARTLWNDLLERTPADAQWREMLAERLARLDLLIAAEAQAQTMQ